jgi:hypothetical protein
VNGEDEERVCAAYRAEDLVDLLGDENEQRDQTPAKAEGDSEEWDQRAQN